MNLVSSSTAVISECGRYRYSLTRRVGAGDRRVLFVMLNPSTADAEEDDPTIRRCMGFARLWGCGWLDVINLFAYRATRPTDLPADYDLARGPRNSAHQVSRVLQADTVVCAWGASPRAIEEGPGFRHWLKRRGTTAHVLKLTKSGQPGHPLYLRKDLQPIPWVLP